MVICMFLLFQMDDTTSFFEHPLDQNLYEPKKFVQSVKQPLRILVTEAGSKIAYNLIYKICSGNVFGPDQEIILHLINARGAIHHKAIVLELVECGFDCFKDFVVSSNPAVAFKNVEVVIAIATFEEIPGFIIPGAIIHQIIKALQLLKRIKDYSAKDCKVVFTGPATKAMTVMLSALYKFAPNFNLQNISCVTHLDTVISKAVLAAKLKTTTDKIKNIIIWSATYPDIHNSTVQTYPPGDKGATETKDIPVTEVLQDEEWLYSNFGEAIYKRIMNADLLNFGKAIALSTAHHLRVLFGGSDNFEEIHSMGVITPLDGPYDIPVGLGFSYPVKTEKGRWKILEGISAGVPTKINMIRTLSGGNGGSEGKVKDTLLKAVSYVIDYDITKQQMAQFFSKDLIDKLLEIRKWTTNQFVIPSPAETVEKINKNKTYTSRKSIAWGEAVSSIRNFSASLKPSAVFSTDVSKNSRFVPEKLSVDFSNDNENPFPTSFRRHSAV